jgi:hypothetical protein
MGVKQSSEEALRIRGINHACSACRRSNKACTFDWLRNLSPSALPERLRLQFNLQNDSESSRAWLTTQNDMLTSEKPLAPAFNTLNENNAVNPLNTYLLSSVDDKLVSEAALNATFRPFGVDFPPGDLESNNESQNECRYAMSHSTMINFSKAQSTGNFDHSTEPWELIDSSGAFSGDLLHHSSMSRTEISGNVNALFLHSIFPEDDEVVRGDKKGKKTVTNYSDWPPRHFGANSSKSTWADLSPTPKRKHQLDIFDSEIANNTAKHTIALSMLKLFEDTYEGATCCWTAVSNCPFKVEKPDSVGSATSMTTKNLASGGLWSRIMRLDKRFQCLRPQPLSARETRRASNSLKLSIMAFASQWGLERKDKQAPSSASFARLMHRSLWNEASRTLERCSHLTSFRVVISALILSLVTKPTDNDESDFSTDDEFGGSNDQDGPVKTSVFSDTASDSRATTQPLQQFRLRTSHSRPNITETPTDSKDWRLIAFKQLNFWKQQLFNGLVIRRGTFNFTLNAEFGGLHGLSEADIEDFFLMIWHGLAFDSMLSVMMNTPFYLSVDLGPTESPLSAAHEPFQSTEVQSAGVDIEPGTKDFWNVAHLAKSQFPRGDVQFSIPNTTGHIEIALQDAVPTTMLHWRNVGTLRIYAQEEIAPLDLEDKISSSLQVYTHWGLHHFSVMQFCLENYPSLPFKIQTWYIYLYASWTLACFLLAECIEDIDSKFDIDHPQKQWRVSTCYACDIKKDSAFAFTNLAKVLRSNASGKSEYHEFLAESGAHEGQPWPTVFNLCLAKACETYLSWIDQSHRRNHDATYLWILRNVNVQELVCLSSSCIEGLRELNWKSRSATSERAGELQSRLEEVTEGHLLFE